MSTDPRETISGSPMSRMQIVAVAITFGLNALDGFDILSTSFASPGIAAGVLAILRLRPDRAKERS